MPKGIVIYSLHGWQLTSYGNGWAYLLEDIEEAPRARSAWFQDDDANQFRQNVMDDDGFLVNDCEERFADYSEVMQESR